MVGQGSVDAPEFHEFMIDIVSCVVRRSKWVSRCSRVCARGCELVDNVGGRGLVFEVFIDCRDLVVEDISKVVAQFLGGCNAVLGGSRVGELLQDGEEFLAVV